MLSSTSLSISPLQWQKSIELLQKLIQAHPIYATEGLAQAQRTLVHYMRQYGWDVMIEDHFTDRDIRHLKGYVDVSAFGPFYQNYAFVPKCNIIGIMDSHRPGPCLILNGHIDVDLVSFPKAWSLKEGWRSGSIEKGHLYGRGSTDMLAGLVAQVTAAHIFCQYKEEWRGRIILTAVTDEEIGGNGTLRALDWLQSHHYLQGKVECLIAEPSDGRICLDSLGFLHILLDFSGRPVHMGVAQKADNALWSLCHFINQFDELLYQVASALDPNIRRETLIANFGYIRGGEDSAIPIPSLHLEGTIFFPESLSPVSFCTALKQTILNQFKQIDVCFSSFGFEGAHFNSSSLYTCLQRIQPSSNDLFPSPCDARLFKSYGIPTVIYGPGSLKQAHAVDEFISLSQLKDYIETLLIGMHHFFNL